METEQIGGRTRMSNAEGLTICYWNPDGKGHRTGWMPLPMEKRNEVSILTDEQQKRAVWFTPQEIRDHFADDPADPTLDLSDEDLLAVGLDAVGDDRIWTAFHEALIDSVREVRERKEHDALTAGNRPPYDVPMTNAKVLGILADSINQLAIMVEDVEYARTTGLRANTNEFQRRQKRLRKIREWVAPLIEP